jgi:hypothetical protein
VNAIHWQRQHTPGGWESRLFRGRYTIVVFEADVDELAGSGRWQIREALADGRDGYAVKASGASPFFADAKIQAFDAFRRLFSEPRDVLQEATTAARQGAERERAIVVAWLRAYADIRSTAGGIAGGLANAIERGEHLK